MKDDWAIKKARASVTRKLYFSNEEGGVPVLLVAKLLRAERKRARQKVRDCERSIKRDYPKGDPLRVGAEMACADMRRRLNGGR